MLVIVLVLNKQYIGSIQNGVIHSWQLITLIG